MVKTFEKATINRRRSAFARRLAAKAAILASSQQLELSQRLLAKAVLNYQGG